MSIREQFESECQEYVLNKNMFRAINDDLVREITEDVARFAAAFVRKHLVVEFSDPNNDLILKLPF